MRVECACVGVELVEQDLVVVAFGDENVEPQASGLVPEGQGGVLTHQFEKGVAMAGNKREKYDEGECHESFKLR